MTTLTREPPEESAPRIVATFFVEYLPGVRSEYELLEKAADEPLKISLADLQMETLIFALHCLDRAVFAHCGARYRAAFMDHAFDTAYYGFAQVLAEDLREPFLTLFERDCQSRQREYGAMKLLPGDDGSLKDVLCWEYAKRICLTAGVREPLALKAMLGGANGMREMMDKIAGTL